MGVYGGDRRRLYKYTCTFCGKEYYRPKSKAGAYCSRECASVASVSRVLIECSNCGTLFERRKSRAGTAKSGLSFCSRKCKDEAQRVESGILVIDHYKNGKWSYRQKAINEYGAACSRCGYDKCESALEVHHMDRNRENSGIDNLVVLCANCHREEHTA